MDKHFLLGKILIEEGLLSQADLDKALEAQKKTPNVPIGEILVKQGSVTDKQVTYILSKQLKIPYATREKGLLTPSDHPDLPRLIPEEFARKNHVMPLAITLNSLTVAVTDPLDIVLLDNLYKLTGYHIHCVVATKSDIDASINEFYEEGGMLKRAVEASYTTEKPVDEAVSDERLSLDDIVASAEKAPVVKLTDLLIRQAIRERASDIHIEPFQDKISIRFRIDGVLKEISPPDRAILPSLISRLKILSKMDIAEKRLPQDGSFRAGIENRMIDFRVSTIPTIHGEKMVMRILDRSSVSLNLQTLGFEKEELEKFRKAIRKPYGMILLTGPTGSGKTTTLYAALNEIKGTDKNITTIEDPVEYQLAGINQVQIKPSIGLTFASGLRSFLRQDPDIMLVGEIRDLETAQICVRAALTGHLVFSSLHTNDAPTAITRLIDVGVEPFFVSSSLLMVVAQRLVRKLCPKCKEGYKPSAVDAAKMGAFSAPIIYRPKGCEHCSSTGYLGRFAIYEIMEITEKLEEMILNKASVSDIRHEAQKNGLLQLEETGYKKVAAGMTSLDEVMRVTLSTGV